MKQPTSLSNIFRQAFSNLKANDPIRMAAATAFFAFFGLPSIIIILSQVLSLLFNDPHQSVRGQLFRELAQLFGPQSARQLQDISQHLQARQADRVDVMITIGILLLTATTLFAVMKSSLNQLWNVKSRPDRSFLHGLKDRAVALGIILGSGLLFTASVAINQALAPAEGWRALLQLIGSLAVLVAWFAMLFAYLPDVRVRWPAILVGALVTGILFLIGEWALTRLLTYNQLRSLHGGAGAITLVLLFVFYCALIFYYGASFTRQYATWARLDMVPDAHAVGYTITEVDESPDGPTRD